jgi:hypothetical protein
LSRDRGFVATEFVLGIGVLLVPVAMLVLTLPSWSERQSTARSIAREAGRSIAVAGWCDGAHAQRVSDVMSDNLGVASRDVSVTLDCAPGRLPRGGEVEVRVTVVMPAVSIPGITDVARWHWTAVHRHPVDPYRSFG